MRRICIVCEGQTEVEFVKSCLTPHFSPQGLWVYPALLQSPSGKHRGGRVTIERLAKFISHQYREADRITTLVDFYGFQDRNGRNRAEVEAAILEQVAQRTPQFDPRFVLPYVQMHEFEGLLFTDINEFEWVLDAWSDASKAALSAIASQFPCPEDINDGPETAPSKRILSIFPRGAYSKTEHGPLIAAAIGLDAIRAKCPAFNEWIRKLEAWAN